MSDKNDKRTPSKEEHQDTDKQMVALLRGLAAIDDNVRAHGYPGEPGTGLFLLLENLAAQLGINRAGFPVEAAQVEHQVEHQVEPSVESSASTRSRR